VIAEWGSSFVAVPITQREDNLSSLRTAGSVVGFLVAAGFMVWLGIRLAKPWYGIAFWAVVIGSLGARIGSLSLPSIWQHKLLIQMLPFIGALTGFFLGLYLVHGNPAQGAFGWQVVLCCAGLSCVGFALPMIVLHKLIPVRCPRCCKAAYLGSDSTFLRNMLAAHYYGCRSCGHKEYVYFRQL
jgi:hypothetical protein